MPGFRSDHINLIAANLRDRYKSGFPILKELIQNADDARAGSLAFGYHKGFAGQSQHPLLQGPALWVLNDGEFKESDKRAIQSFGLNSKAGESGAIGKFGLGMKSVFHLCEAFFYVAFDGHTPHGVILNPWFDPEEQDLFHNAWEQVDDDDFSRMHEIASGHRQVEPGKSYLLLWLPLRMRQHVPEINGKPYGAIIDKFPGDDSSQELSFLHESSLPQRISSILPLLKKLNSVQFAGNDASTGFDLCLELDTHSQRVDHKAHAMVAAGVVKEMRSRKEQLKFYVRQNAQPASAPFPVLQNLQSWPKTMRQNGSGTREQVSDKSEAEGAVMISHAEANSAHLQLRWAVFLPTEEGIQTYEASLSSGKRSYQIVLHGQFFVDAGRRGIGGFRHLAEAQIEPRADLDDADLHVAWNQAIAQRVVLPEFLPALAGYVEKHELNDVDIEEITRLISHAASTEVGGARGIFCSIFRDHLYARHLWICELLPTGRRWRLLDRDHDRVLLRLPSSQAKDLAKPWAVMPGLKQISNAIYCDASASALVPRFDEWDENRLLTVLQADVDNGLCDQEGLDYLIEFLRIAGQVFLETQLVQEALIQLVQRGLRTRPIDDFRAVRASFRTLISLIKPERRVFVGTVNLSNVGAVSPSIFALLFSCETRTLLIPADLDATDTRGAGKPSDDDFGAWLLAIDREIRKQSGEQCVNSDEGETKIASLLKAATTILELCGPKGDAKARIVRVHRSARILSALDVNNGQEQASSLESLEAIHATRRLFKQTSFTQRTNVRDTFGHAKLLTEVLVDDVVLIISSEIAGFIQQDGYLEVPSAGDGKAILEALGRHGQPSSLSDHESRRALLKSVHGSVADGDSRRGLRYLLHASPQGFMADQTELWIDPGDVDSPWIKLWRAIEPGSWFVLAENLAGDIPGNVLATLGISKVQQVEVLRRLQGLVDLTTINGADFSDPERETILAAVDDENVWRRLPLHIDTNGTIECIDGNTFLNDLRNAPHPFADGCRFIRLGQNRDYIDKQTRWIPCWTGETTIRRALESDEPHKYWLLILSEVAQLSAAIRYALPELLSVRWLPLANGGMISPEDVIDIKDLANEIDQLSSKCGYPYAGISGLHQDVRTHREFDCLRAFFSVGNAGLPRLGQLMSEIPGHGIGLVSGLGGDELKGISDTLSNLPTLPAWAIVAKAIGIFGDAAVNDYLIVELSKSLPLVDVMAALKAISDSGDDQRHADAFNLYLRQFAQSGTACQSQMHHLRLRSQAGSWQDAARLCVGAAGVVRGSQLDVTQARILTGLIVDNSGPVAAVVSGPIVEANDGFHHGPLLEKVLDEYFRPWCEAMSTPPIGAFLCLLGPQARNLGEKLLEPHSISWLSDGLGWVDPGQGANGTWNWMSRMTVQEALKILDPRIKISADARVEVFTITGDMLSVDLDSSMETIFAGAFNWRGGYAVNITLRCIPNLLDLSPQDLSHLLQRSALYLLQHAYNQKLASITPLWDELEKSDQLSLEVARDLILENLPFYLQQLKVAKRNKILSEALSDLKRLQREKSEAASVHQNTLPMLEGRVGGAKKHLARLMVEDQDVQRAILSGVRERVQQSQYELSSIAFELFQNADDAVSEMQALQEDAGLTPFSTKSIGRFVAEADGNILRFIHWGRPINYTGHGSIANPAYRDDLENMLILSASDKGGGQPVTGKFGLGFKSALLATDTPRILSADLRVKILGGCLPERWTGPEVESAMGAAEQHRATEGQRLRPTLIELHVSAPEDRAKILERFAMLSGVQAIFSKEIRRIAIQDQECEWRPMPLMDDCSSIEIGKIRLPTKIGFSSDRVIVWRGSRAAIAMRLDSQGVVAFEDGKNHSLPSIWVTGPTRETPANGLILNANFELDAGRGALAHGEGGQANLKLVIDIAKEFARDLKFVVQSSRADWDTAQDRLGLAKNVSAANFWASFWAHAVQTSLDDDASQSAELLHQFGTGLLDQFTILSNELPNGMPGALAEFVALNRISLVVGNRWLPSLNPLCGWPDLVARHPFSGWVHEDVAKIIEIAKDQKYPTLSVELIKDCVPNSQCSPETAGALFAILLHVHPFDRILIANSFSALTFKAKDGSWQLGASLLKDKGIDEEFLAVSFAPIGNVIHESYQSIALDFVLEHGGKWICHPGVIASWIFGASCFETRKAGLRYLLEGLSSYGVRQHLCNNLVGSWLGSIKLDASALTPFSTEEKTQLVAMLNPTALEFYVPPVELIISTVRHKVALEKIYAWWADEGKEHSEKYYKNFWPESVPRQFDDTGENRQSWMTLFALGLMQRLGRTRDFQNRGFIDFSDSKGWWTIFCNIRPQDDPEAWMDILKSYATQPTADEKYIRWMDCFPSLYRIAHWMDEYKHIFLSLNQRTVKEMAGYLTPNEDPVLDGSDIYAPSLRSSLRLGQHLVVRELLRAGALKSEAAQSLAYMPSFRVKALFAQIGYPSPENSMEISKILKDALGDRAAFCGDYDIPFIILAASNELQRQVLDLNPAEADFLGESTPYEMEADDELLV
jgi:hypothetical protein